MFSEVVCCNNRFLILKTILSHRENHLNTYNNVLKLQENFISLFTKFISKLYGPKQFIINIRKQSKENKRSNWLKKCVSIKQLAYELKVSMRW